MTPVKNSIQVVDLCEYDAIEVLNMDGEEAAAEDDEKAVDELFHSACAYSGIQSATLKTMMELPVLRRVELRSGRSGLRMSRAINREAVAAQAVGQVELVGCCNCAKGLGCFVNCVRVKIDDEYLLSGSCAACHANGSGLRCSFRDACRPVINNTYRMTIPQIRRSKRLSGQQTPGHKTAQTAPSATRPAPRRTQGSGIRKDETTKRLTRPPRRGPVTQIQQTNEAEQGEGKEENGGKSLTSPSVLSLYQVRSAHLLKVAAAMAETVQVNANNTSKYLHAISAPEHRATAQTLAADQNMFAVACGSLVAALNDAASFMEDRQN